MPETRLLTATAFVVPALSLLRTCTHGAVVSQLCNLLVRAMDTGGASASAAAAPREDRPLSECLATDGYCVGRGILGPELIAEMRKHVDYLAGRFPEIPPEHLHHPIMIRDPFWVRVAAEPALLDFARAVAPDMFADGVALFSSHYLCKVPRADAPDVKMHQVRAATPPRWTARLCPSGWAGRCPAGVAPGRRATWVCLPRCSALAGRRVLAPRADAGAHALGGR